MGLLKKAQDMKNNPVLAFFTPTMDFIEELRQYSYDNGMIPAVKVAQTKREINRPVLYVYPTELARENYERHTEAVRKHMMEKINIVFNSNPLNTPLDITGICDRTEA